MFSLTDKPKQIDRFMERVCLRYVPSLALRELVRLSDNSTLAFSDVHSRIADCDELERQIVQLFQLTSCGDVEPLQQLAELSARFDAAVVQQLAIGVRLSCELQTDLDPRVVTIAWQAALIRAVVAMEFEPTAKLEALAISLVPTSGVFLLSKELGPAYGDFLCQIIENRGDWHELEKHSLEFDHRVVALRLLTNWGMPATLIQPLELSRCPEIYSQPKLDWQPLVRALQIADLVSEVLLLQRPDRFELLMQTLEAAGQRTLADVEQMLVGVSKKFQALAASLLLKIDVPTDLDDRFQQVKALWKSASDSQADDSIYEQLLVDSAALSDLMGQARQSAPSRKTPLGKNQTAHAGHPPRGPAIVVSDALLEQVAELVVECRQTRSSLSLMLVEIDNYPQLTDRLGSEGAERLLRRLQDSIERTVGKHDCSLLVAPARWAVTLPSHDKSSAVETAKLLMNEIRSWSKMSGQESRRLVTVSVGLASLAIPPRNFPPQDLIDAAQRCLNAAHATGGDGVKSIEL